MRRSSLSRLAMTVALVGGLAGAAQAQIVTNGGFESPVVTPGGFALYGAGSGALTGWSVGVANPNDVLLHSTTYTEPGNGVTFNAGAGLQSLDITGNGNTGPGTQISQVLTTVAGQLYDLNFLLGHASGITGPLGLLYDPAIAAAVRVQLVDVATSTVLADVVKTNGGVSAGAINWADQLVRFTATGTSTTLRFITAAPTGGPTPPNYSGLDSVAVTAVPEPGPLALCAAGLPLFLGLSWFRARRKAS